MVIEDTEQLKAEIDKAAAERSESDQRNFTLTNLIRHQTAVVNFQNCESFTAAPFDRCRTDRDKRRMFASMLAMAAACHLDKLSAPAVAENYSIIHNIYTGMKEFEPDYLYGDPYLSSVSLPLGEKNGFMFGIEDIKMGQLFHYDTPAESGYADIPRLGYFHADMHYPVVHKNGKVLTALNPNYFETMKKHAAVASGDVLCLGLKMGYFPFLTSMKESVRTITVVEEDSDLVALFENQILGQFPHAEKIIVLNEEPLAFLMDEWKREYRHVFVCCGYDAMSSINIYMQIKQLEKNHKKTKFTYWLEGSILSDIKSALLILLVGTKDSTDLFKTLEGDEQGQQIMDQVRPFADQLHLQSAKDIRSLFNNKALARRIAGAV